MAADDDTSKLLGLIDEFATATDSSFFERVGSPDFQYVNPSGYSTTPTDYQASTDIQSASLLALHCLEVGDVMAHALITQTIELVSGDPDTYTATLIFKKEDDAWKLSWVQRSASRAPSDPAPAFKFSQRLSRRMLGLGK